MALISKIIFFFTLFILLSFCSSSQCIKSQNDTANNKSKIKISADELFKKDCDVIYNISKEYALCIERYDEDRSKKFFIYDVSAGTVIFKDSFVLGNVVWSSDYEVKLTLHPGIITKDENNVKPKYIYNVLTNTKSNPQ